MALLDALQNVYHVVTVIAVSLWTARIVQDEIQVVHGNPNHSSPANVQNGYLLFHDLLRFKFLVIVLLDFNGQMNLILWMSIGIDLTDATFEQICPTHFQNGGNGLVVLTGQIAYLVVLAILLVVIHHRHSVHVVTILQIALHLQHRAHLQLVPHLIGIVIFSSCQMKCPTTTEDSRRFFIILV